MEGSEALPAVTLIVLNWNGRALLEACLPALLALDYPDTQIVVVDNGSTDDSVAWLRSNLPMVTVMETGANLGFAGGNNVALRALETDIAVLVNPDIMVARDWLRQLMRPMVADKRIGIAGSKLYYPGGELLQFAGGEMRRPQALPRHFGLRENDEGQHDAMRDVDYIIGAALAVRRNVVEQVGLLDEGYFLYFEDADWCERVRRAGYRVVYVPQATAVHEESVLTVKGSAAYLARFQQGRWRFLLKHLPLDMILGETFAAEEAWMAQKTPDERRGLDAAYRATLARLPAILAARVADGQRPISGVDQAAIARGLERLRVRANLPPSAVTAAALRQRAVVEEQPFRSSAPVIGPLLAWLRSLWNSVAAKWYVRGLVQQQNDFNLALAEALAELQTELEAHTAISLAIDSEEAMLAEMRTELREELAKTMAYVARIEGRLERLERPKPSANEVEQSG